MIQWKCWTWYQEVTDDKEKVFHIYIKDEILKKKKNWKIKLFTILWNCSSNLLTLFKMRKFFVDYFPFSF